VCLPIHQQVIEVALAAEVVAAAAAAAAVVVAVRDQWKEGRLVHLAHHAAAVVIVAKCFHAKEKRPH
jgi:hypothetical protein